MNFKKNAITIGGRTFFYWENNNAGKEVVILLHGFPGNHMGLLALAGNLPGSCRIILPDLPACGQSDELENEHTLKNYSAWIDSFLAQLSIDKAVIIGHSFGSRVALVFTADHPQKIEKLVLITPVVKVEGFIPRLASLKGSIAKLLPARLRKVWLSNKFYQDIAYLIVFKTADEKKKREISLMDAKELKHLKPQATLQIFDEFYHSDLTLLGPKIPVETLIIAGSKDEIATLKSVEELAGSLSKVSLEVIKNAGHLLPLEKAPFVAKIVEAFLWK